MNQPHIKPVRQNGSTPDIAALAGHVSTVVTEKVYRHELRPVLRTGAKKMDEIFPDLQLTET